MSRRRRPPRLVTSEPIGSPSLPKTWSRLAMATDRRRRHDVVVVGARAAGAATALLMARLGHDVVLLDRAVFPADTISTHQLARTGVVQLHRWGLLQAVLDSGAPPIRQVTFTAGDEVKTRVI